MKSKKFLKRVLHKKPDEVDMSDGVPAKGAFERILVWKLVKTKDPVKMDNDDLLFAHSMTHAFHMSIERGVKIKDWTPEELVVYHEKIVKEMVTREFLVRLTPNALDDSVKYLFPAVEKKPEMHETKTAALGEGDAPGMTKPAPATLVRDTLVCPKCQKSVPSSMKVCPSCGTSLASGTHSKMVKAFEFLTLYDVDSVLTVLAIAEEAGMLKSIDDQPKPHAKIATMDVSKEMALKDYEYLLHHIAVDDEGKEEVHHCMLYDHIANMFVQAHLVVKDGKVVLDDKPVSEGFFHVISALEATQEVAWSDADALKEGVKAKALKAGMTLKQKAKEW